MLDDGTTPYPANLNVDYSPKLDRVSSALRFIYVLPIAIILSLVSAGSGPLRPETDVREQVVHELRARGVDVPEDVAHAVEAPRGAGSTTAGVGGGLFAATALMVLVRRRYPRWWFDFGNNLAKFSARVVAYAALLTDRYPSTEDEQAVHVDLVYPDAAKLNRWLPLVKWLLAIPHYIALAFLSLGAVVAVVIAWFAILFTGKYPRALFDYVVVVGRWALRVQAYAFLLLTDDYPPFTLYS